MARIYDLNGYLLSSGLPGCIVCNDARKAAESIADNNADDVILKDDDGTWLVHHRNRDGSRETADLIEIFAPGESKLQ